MSMTYDQLYTSDEFRLIAGCVSADDRNYYHARFSGRLEAFQLCSGGWPGPDRPRGKYEIGFGGEGSVSNVSFHGHFLTAGFVYASRVLVEAWAQTTHRFPDWLDHRWVDHNIAWRKLAFNSPARFEAEEFCNRAIQEIANSGKISVIERYSLFSCDRNGNDVQSPDESGDSCGRSQKALVVVDVPSLTKEITDSLCETVALGSAPNIDVRPRSFGYEDIAPYIVRLNPWLLSLRNMKDGAPPFTDLDKALFDAVERLDMPMAIEMVARGANINAMQDGETALTKLTEAWIFEDSQAPQADEICRRFLELTQTLRIGMMQQLIELGADVNLFGFDGVYPLTAAVLNHEAEVVEFLLSKGADHNRSNYRYEDPEELSTPLYYARNDYDCLGMGIQTKEETAEEEKILDRINAAFDCSGAL